MVTHSEMQLICRRVFFFYLRIRRTYTFHTFFNFGKVSSEFFFVSQKRCFLGHYQKAFVKKVRVFSSHFNTLVATLSFSKNTVLSMVFFDLEIRWVKFFQRPFQAAKHPHHSPCPNASRQVSAKCRRDGGCRLETGRSRGEKNDTIKTVTLFFITKWRKEWLDFMIYLYIYIYKI